MKDRTSYHNTNDLEQNEADRYAAFTGDQERQILAWFEKHGTGSPSQVGAFFRQLPITSVRRGITNLTNRSKLNKTSKTRIGPYGRPENIWEIAQRQADLW